MGTGTFAATFRLRSSPPLSQEGNAFLLSATEVAALTSQEKLVRQHVTLRPPGVTNRHPQDVMGLRKVPAPCQSRGGPGPVPPCPVPLTPDPAPLIPHKRTRLPPGA